jgi:hypothetical protein
MNEAGVSFGCLNLPYGPPRMGGGIPYNLVGRALAPRAESVETAQEILTGWRQTSRAKSWPLVDGNGHSLAVEKCFDRTGVVKPDEEGVMALANDYLSPQLEDLADRDPSSAERAKTLREFVATQRLGGALTVETMMDALRIHATVGSICRHGGFEPSDRGGFTGSAVVYLPEKREMHVMCGDHPCRAAFHALTFDF